MAAWLFMSMAGCIDFLLYYKNASSIRIVDSGFRDLRSHVENREWNTSTVSDQLKTEIKSLKTDKQNLQKTIQRQFLSIQN